MRTRPLARRTRAHTKQASDGAKFGTDLASNKNSAGTSESEIPPAALALTLRMLLETDRCGRENIHIELIGHI